MTSAARSKLDRTMRARDRSGATVLSRVLAVAAAVVTLVLSMLAALVVLPLIIAVVAIAAGVLWWRLRGRATTARRDPRAGRATWPPRRGSRSGAGEGLVLEGDFVREVRRDEPRR